MFESFGSSFGQKPPHKGGPSYREPSSGSPMGRQQDTGQRQSFTKIFRWRLPEGQTEAPKTVEIVGSFTRWHPVPLTRDGVLDAWHAMIHHIPGNRMHHYMLLVDGRPTYDKNCDGYAVPHGPEEEQYQLMTEKGPRVLMLFSQTK